MNSALLYSSGLDSYIAYYYLQDKYNINPMPIYFDVRSRYSEIEKMFVSRFDNYKIDYRFDFSEMEQKDGHINNRNLYFSIAASDYSPNIYIGGTKSDRVSDNDSEVLNLQGKVLSNVGNQEIVITSPFWNEWKCELVKWFCEKFHRYKLLQNTFSCYFPVSNFKNNTIYDIKNRDKLVISGRECLSCKACFRRNAALFSASFFIPFFNEEIAKNYEEEMAEKDNPRAINTMKYLEYRKEFLNG